MSTLLNFIPYYGFYLVTGKEKYSLDGALSCWAKKWNRISSKAVCNTVKWARIFRIVLFKFFRLLWGDSFKNLYLKEITNKTWEITIPYTIKEVILKWWFVLRNLFFNLSKIISFQSTSKNRTTQIFSTSF